MKRNIRIIVFWIIGCCIVSLLIMRCETNKNELFDDIDMGIIILPPPGIGNFVSNRISVVIDNNKRSSLFADSLIKKFEKHGYSARKTSDSTEKTNDIIVIIKTVPEISDKDSSFTLFQITTNNKKYDNFIVLNKPCYIDSVKCINEMLSIPENFFMQPEIITCLYTAFLIKNQDKDKAIKMYEYTAWLLKYKFNERAEANDDFGFSKKEVEILLNNIYSNIGAIYHMMLDKGEAKNEKEKSSIIKKADSSFAFAFKYYDENYFTHAWYCSFLYFHHYNKKDCDRLQEIENNPHDLNDPNDLESFKRCKEILKEITNHKTSALKYAIGNSEKSNCNDIIAPIGSK